MRIDGGAAGGIGGIGGIGSRLAAQGTGGRAARCISEIKGAGVVGYRVLVSCVL